MIAAVKRLIVFLCLFVVLAFVFRDGLLYYVWRWHEKTGEVKKALSGYSELIKKYPDSRWTEKARKAIDRLKK
jgi:outer membrane protein assembly factor BamD (BamD/ComL family)